ncbi:hypothetical protein SAMN05421493_11815 [Pseudobutyrivibrio sp. 49]|uniref:hypothetical protein n=1 Tax=Pseudobutyrivibrio sp. 49 TaxID=1855344 RepID=UPI00088C49C5|nr:hypothetical protein [Pseudobutyrivibrio sp. 49]SDI56100.1 hypothetical protein SAMN05421493_11815 [Pseudobutyrivibrio sp. 49]
MKYIEAYRLLKSQISTDIPSRYRIRYKASKSSNSIIIGGVGFDAVTLSGLEVKDFVPKVPVLENSFLDSSGNSYLKHPDIDDYTVRCKGDFYFLKLSVQKNQTVCKLDLRHIQDGSNLTNINLEQLKESYNRAVKSIKEYYGIEIISPIDELRIKKAELNVTFPLIRPFDEYSRVFQIMSFALSQIKKPSVANKDTVGSFGTWVNGKLKEGTNYLIKGATLSVKSYNKTEELLSKNEKTLDCDCCRLEITASEQTLRQVPPKPILEVRYKDLTDEDIKVYFHNYFEQIFNYIDTYFKERLDSLIATSAYHANRTGANRDELLSAILNTTFKKSLRLDPDTLIEDILNTFFIFEAQTHRPLLFDIDDLLEVDSAFGMTGFTLDEFKRTILTLKKQPERFNEAIHSYIDQRILLDEIRTCSTVDHEFFCISDVDSNRYLCVEPESTTKDDLICQSIDTDQDIHSKAIFKTPSDKYYLRVLLKNMVPAGEINPNYSKWIGLELPEYTVGVRAIPERVAMKCSILAELGNHGWEYPKRLNAIWPGVNPEATISDEELEYIVNPNGLQDIDYTDTEIKADEYDELLNEDSESILEDMYYTF